jgi:predicted double-glycine peptidase
MHIIVWFVIMTSLFAGIGKLYEPPEGHHYMIVDTEQQIVLNTYVTSRDDLRSRHLVMQEFDYSCGSAALATLLNYYIGEQFTETQVIQGLLNHGNPESIKERRAFSLLDMKRFVDVLGYQGAGYKAEMKNLMELDVPVVLPIQVNDYRHFVVFRGIYDNRVFLADPFLGHTTYPVGVFEEMWYRQVIFMIEPGDRPTHNLMALTMEDMQYIGEDMVLWTLFPPTPLHTEFWHLKDEWRYLQSDAFIYQR